MLKKIISISLALLMILGITGCSSEEKKEDTKEETEETVKEFTESSGLVKYITIGDTKLTVPETVGEYVTYLEKVGEVEFGDTGKSVAKAPDMNANGIGPFTSFLKVSTTGDNYQWFGIHYFNPKDKEIAVSDANVDRIIVAYDPYAESEPEKQQIKTIVLATAYGDIALDGKTKAADIMELLGPPLQITDGFLKYEDNGFTYKFATENPKTIVTQVQIDYPK